MTSLQAQISRFVEAAQYEEALNLYSNSPDSQQADIDIKSIHAKFAAVLYSKGDFDGAVTNYLAADADLLSVLGLFPEFVPVSLVQHLYGRDYLSPSGSNERSGVILYRAAAALVHYCERMRMKVTAAADTIQTRIPNMMDHESVKRSILLDTVLVHAHIMSSPASAGANRRNAVIDILSGPNRCHIESTSVIVAAQGNTFAEALLWLYRSHGEHKRVLGALSEDRCVGTGAWTRESYYDWTADYLQWLWHSNHSGNADITNSMLAVLKTVFEYDAQLGLSVIAPPPSEQLSPVANSYPIKDMVSFLEHIAPGANKNSNSDFNAHTIPLISGTSLALAYLEYKVAHGDHEAPMMYVTMLMQNIPTDGSIDHMANDLAIKSSDSTSRKLYKIYRSKLQKFLESSNDCNAEVLLRYLPSELLHEYALLLSRLGQHHEVLKIYILQLNDTVAAERYCDRIYTATQAAALQQNQSSDAEENVYLCLMKVLLALSPTEGSKIAIDAAEHHFDRIDAMAFLSLLPPTTPVAMLQTFLTKSIQFGNAKNRNLQVIYQLLRVREVNLRTSETHE